MNYAVCCIPVSPLKMDPSHKSEMVSQLLFGDTCTIIETGNDHWVKIRAGYDGYEGWCQEGQITAIDEAQFNSKPVDLTAERVNVVNYNGQEMMVPMGCSLTGMDKGNADWNKNSVHFEGKTWNPVDALRDEKVIRQVAFTFLNTSYLWGGKSIFGIDCSGFSQTVYKFLNFFLPRDAHQQAVLGDVVGFLQEARCGDLAFFDNKEGKITHVGILLNEQELIHASVKVRVDKIDSQGIVNQDNFQRTHRLRIIKRYF